MSVRFLATLIALSTLPVSPAPGSEPGDLLADVELLELAPADGTELVVWVDLLTVHEGEGTAGTIPVRVEREKAAGSFWRPGDVRRLRLREQPDGDYRLLSEGDLTAAEREDPDPLPPGIVLEGGATDDGLQLRSSGPGWEQQVVELVNQERWVNGQLPPLKHEPSLTQAAEGHSEAMALRDFYAHCDLDTKKSPWDRMADVGYFFTWAGENIAAGYSSPQAVMTGWMNSSPHRANILSTTLREIGVGHRQQSGDQGNVRRDINPKDCTADASLSGPYGHYWTQKFGVRGSVDPVVIEREAYSTQSRTVDLFVYGSGWAQEMRFSNDGTSWSAWQTFSSNKSWQLSAGNGVKTVWVELRNGSTIRGASDNILLGGDVGIFTDGFETGSTSAWN